MSAAAESRPWPVMLMTALGAWLAAVPLALMIFEALGPVLLEGLWPYFIGDLLLLGSVAVLRRRSLPLFVEQLAVPGLLAGALCLGFVLFRDLPNGWAAALLALLALALAASIARRWLRVLLGAAAAGFALLALDAVLAPLASSRWQGGSWSNWLALHLLLGSWVLALAMQARLPPSGAALIDAIAVGWVLACLVGLGGISASQVRWPTDPGQHLPLMAVGSALLAAAGALWAARIWPGLRRSWLLVTALVLVAGATLMPGLGAVLFTLSLLVCSGRWRLAAAAAVLAAWTVGSFYYQLNWPLAQKALWLAAAGMLLGGMAAWQMRARSSALAAREKFGLRPAVVIASALLILLVANAAIWQKERLIASGQPVFVALAPADPRSLMQGDYMRLNFALPEDVGAPLLSWDEASRPQLSARLDGRRVVTQLRMRETTAPLADDEILLELTPKDGRWILVTDAWFFKEGEAARFAKARFGEFRVQADGRALLVGLADQNLQPIRP